MAKSSWSVIFIGIFVWLLVVSAGCVPEKVKVLRVGGAADMLPLIEKTAAITPLSDGATLEVVASRNTLADLRAGKVDAAIIGRELTPEELVDLNSTVIAYDAVCLLINTRTYNGGIQQGYVNMGAYNLLQPQAKFVGLKELSQEQLKELFANILGINKDEELWVLPGSYFTFQPFTLEESLVPKEHPDNPGHVAGTWVWNQIPLSGEVTPPGMIDAQEALLQMIGYSNKYLEAPGVGFVTTNIGSEEEWISSRFEIEPNLENEISSFPFTFYLMPASRQVTLRAQEHGFRVRAIAIDGIDPMDPENIYTNRYPFQRKVYFVTRQSSENIYAQELLKFLLTTEGQALIHKASFLPLPKS
jgi:hypothetical protein